MAKARFSALAIHLGCNHRSGELVTDKPRLALVHRPLTAEESTRLNADLTPKSLTPAERQAAQDPGLPAKENTVTDPTVAPQDALKPGVKTSEFKLTALVMIAGFALDALGILGHDAVSLGLDNPYLRLGIVLIGALMALMAKLGYTRGRILLKLASLDPTLAAPLIPVAKSLIAGLKPGQSATTPPAG